MEFVFCLFYSICLTQVASYRWPGCQLLIYYSVTHSFASSSWSVFCSHYADIQLKVNKVELFNITMYMNPVSIPAL